MYSESRPPEPTGNVLPKKEIREFSGERKKALADLWTQVVIDNAVPPQEISEMQPPEIRKWLFESLMADVNILAEEWGLHSDTEQIGKIQQADPGAEREKLEIDYFLAAHDKIDERVQSFSRSPEKSTKWDSWPKKMRETGEFNCVGATLLGIRALNAAGIENYLGNPYGHVVNVVKTSAGNWFYVDFRNGKGSVLKIEPEEVMIEGARVLKISTSKLDYRLIPIYSVVDISEAIIGNLASMAKESGDIDVADENPNKIDAKMVMARYDSLFKRQDVAGLDVGSLGEYIFPEIIRFDASPEMKNEENRIKQLHNFYNEIDTYLRSLPKEANARVNQEMEKKIAALLKLVSDGDRAIFDGASDELKGFLTVLISSIGRLKNQLPEIYDEAIAIITERIKSHAH